MTPDELRKLAEDVIVTELAWDVIPDDGTHTTWLVSQSAYANLEKARDSFASAANPKTVLELLDRIAELEGALKPFADAARNFDRFPIKDASEWFAYSGQSSGDSVRHGAISVANLRRAAELVRP